MIRKALYFSVVLLSGSLLMSTAAAAEQTAAQMATKQVILTEAEKNGPKISEDEALKIIQSAFPEIIGDGKPQMNLDYDSYQGRNIWRINNDERMYYGPGMPAGYDASLDADTGDILNMIWRNSKTPGETKGIIQRQEAQKTAEQFVKKLQPGHYNHLQLQKGPAEYYNPQPNLNIVHNFSWLRVENGIIVDYDGVNVAVDALTGQIVNYNFNWRPDVKLPAVGTPVPAKELNAKAINELGMALVYQVPYRNYSGTIPEAKLIYQPNTQGLMFNASTGKAVDNHGKEKEIKDISMFGDVPKVSGVNNPPDTPGQSITVEKAMSTAEEFFRTLGIEGEVKMNGGGSSGGPPFGNQELWSFTTVQKDSSSSYSYTQVSIDQTTGRVINYNEFGPNMQADASPPKISRKEALARANEFIKKMAPEYSPYLAPEKDQMDIMYINGNEQGYNFHFYRVVNGIPFPQDGIHMGISGDGKIKEYNCDWHKISFPAVPAGAVKKRDAARLITSAMNNYYGNDGRSDKQFQDINPGDPDFNAIQTGALLGVYDKGGNFNPEQPVTRLTLARWMVNALGYAEVAKINTNIISSYKDIASLSATDRNYIGLAQGLGIMQGDETGLFKPSDNVTWEELAAVVINSAPKIRNKMGTL